MKLKISSGFCAIIPLLIFFVIFIGNGIYFTLHGQKAAFYQISASVAIIPAIIMAFSLTQDPFEKTLNIFLRGAGSNNIIIMCLIYLLAGAFGSVLQNIGSVASIVNLALSITPANAILPALFLLAAFVSTAMGTSMGTISTIGPIGVGIANSIGLHLPLTMGVIVGGAMFGDNLSIISDTSFAAAHIHGCSVREKFKSNILVALPAMITTVILLAIIGSFDYPTVIPNTEDYQKLKCLPYLFILVLALLGSNVFLVLIVGIVLAGIVGFITVPHYTIVEFSTSILDGYKSMTELLILSLLMGGFGELIKKRGGFLFLNNKLSLLIFSKKEQFSKKIAEIVIGIIASFCDICVANNTVAIILSGEATKEIAIRYRISSVRTATLVDIFTCVFQGLLPYGAQLLMAGKLSDLSPLSIIPHVHYCLFLAIVGLLFIIFQPLKLKVAIA